MSTLKSEKSENLLWAKISGLMVRENVNAKKLAYISGVAPSAVMKWKNGSGIGSDKLKRIAQHFGVTVDWLLSDNTEEPLFLVREPRADYGPSPPSLVQALDVVATSLGATREEVFDQFCAMVKKRMREDDCEKSA
jgi:transcriptional regulator with XRE-family HTH domain